MISIIIIEMRKIKIGLVPPLKLDLELILFLFAYKGRHMKYGLRHYWIWKHNKLIKMCLISSLLRKSFVKEDSTMHYNSGVSVFAVFIR